MNRILASFALLLVATSAHAQLPVPKLNSIFPCGGRQGAAIECTVNGGDLDKASGLFFSHPGIRGEFVKGNTYRVTIGKDVPVGQYDVRVVTPLGLSNFRAFIVSDWPEVVEKEPNNDPEKAQRVELPVVVSGQMDGQTDLDHYVFAAKKGQRITINCWAWRIDSQMDATLLVTDKSGKEIAYSGDYYGRDPFIDFTAPADGDYIVKIWDFVYGGGNTYFYRLQMGSLPHLDAVIPAAVNPGKKTTVTLYGRNLPGGKPAPANVTIGGRPLEMLEQVVDVPADPEKATSLSASEAWRPAQTVLDGMPLRLTSSSGSSNAIFLGFTDAPILLEKEPNNDQATAQRLPIPCDVTGTFAPAGDLDYYAFTAKKGEKIVVETLGERMTPAIDPIITAFDAKGKKLGSFDDVGRNIGQIRFTTTTRDARWDFTAPADGEYFAQVRDSYYQQRGEARFVYRLSVRRLTPDFRVVAIPMAETQPDCTVVRRGGHHWMDILVFRNDGFDDPIRIEAEKLPPGVTCEPVVVGPGKQSVPLVFKAADDAPIGERLIRLVAKATIDGKEVTRVVRGGGIVWGTTNTPAVARLTDGITLVVRDPAPFAVAATPSKTTVAPGEKLSIAVKVERAKDWSESVQFAGYDLPQNATIGLVTVPNGAGEGKVELSLPANLKPGTYSFVLTAAGQVPRDYALTPASNTPRGNGQRMRVVYPTNAITITVTSTKN
jgi:hypothetical protein